MSIVTTRVDPELARDLSQYDITFTGVVENTFLRDLLGWIVPALVFFGVWMFLAKRVMGGQGGIGGMMSIGKSKAKVYVETDTKVTFADVAGVDAAVTGIVASAFKRALDLLARNRATLERAAARLLERETLTEPDLISIAAALAPDGRQVALPEVVQPISGEHRAPAAALVEG